MRCYRPLWVSAMLLAVAAGCASTDAPSDSAAHAQHAQCMVCEYNADLTCVDVTVDSKTPQYAYQGKTYYFCSEQCRDEFAKNPSKCAK